MILEETPARLSGSSKTPCFSRGQKPSSHFLSGLGDKSTLTMQFLLVMSGRLEFQVYLLKCLVIYSGLRTLGFPKKKFAKVCEPHFEFANPARHCEL